jgi:hypothetical protein
MRNALVAMIVAAASVVVASAQISAPSAASPLTNDVKFRMYFRQTYSVPSVLFPAAFAGLNQATNSPEQWGQGGSGYLKRLATQRGQFQIGAFCGFATGSLLHEDPRFFPSHKRGMLVRTGYVLTHTLVAHSDRGTPMPAYGNYAAAIGAGFAPAGWLPQSANSITSSLERTAAMFGMKIGMNMGIEFGPDDRRFFHDRVLRRLRHAREVQDQLP